MATPLKGQQLINWYNRINAVRNKTGIALGNISLTNVINTPATAVQINNLKASINALKSNTYLGKADYTGITNVNVNSKDLIQLSTKTNIEATITSLEGICANKSTSVCTDNTDQSNDSNCSNYYDDADRSRETSDCTDNTRNATDQAACPEYLTADILCDPQYETCNDYSNNTRDYMDDGDDITCSDYSKDTDNAKTQDCQTDYIVTGNTVTN